MAPPIFFGMKMSCLKIQSLLLMLCWEYQSSKRRNKYYSWTLPDDARLPLRTRLNPNTV